METLRLLVKRLSMLPIIQSVSTLCLFLSPRALIRNEFKLFQRAIALRFINKLINLVMYNNTI